MPLTPAALTEFISKKIVEVTSCGARDVSLEFPNASKWVSGFGLVVIFNDQPKPEYRHFALQLVRRTEMALAHYKSGLDALKDLVSGHRGRWSPYFKALSYFEDAMGQLYQAYDASRKVLGKELFTSGDGSPLQRLNQLYNSSKHDPADTEQPVWLTNNGLESEKAVLAFGEFEGLLRTCGRLAEKITSSLPTKGKASV